MLFELIRFRVREFFLMLFHTEQYLKEKHDQRLAIEVLANVQTQMHEELELARLYHGLEKRQ
jgi:hypothetical protein